MLHPYLEASNIQIPCHIPSDMSTPGYACLSLLKGINSWLEDWPVVQGSLSGETIYVIYRHAAFLVEDFWDLCGPAMAYIDNQWSICAYGTAHNQETIRLSAAFSEDALQLIQQSISGESAEALDTLCFQIDCADDKTAEELLQLLNTMDWQNGVAAMQWKDADFLHKQNLILDPQSRGCFCYAGNDAHVTYSECLRSLNFRQKITLWNSFLKDGFDPMEFEWLAHEISENVLVNRMEWELALREALDQQHIRIINGEKTFELYDGVGRRLYFGADCHRTAEWVLLKILFPLNYL